MTFSSIPVEQVDIPLDKLHAKEPEIERYSAGAIIFWYNPQDPSDAKVLLCQRAPGGKDDDGTYKKHSWPYSWEFPGGGHEPKDETILATARREVKEEVGLHGCFVSSHVYKCTFSHKGMLMASYVFPMDVREQIQPQRTWSDVQQKSVGAKESPIKLRDDEHLDFCWFSEAQVRNSLPFDGECPQQGGLTILENKKEIILDFFEKLRNSQLEMNYQCIDEQA